MFCCALVCVHSSIAIILMGKRKRELVALLGLSSWCLVVVGWLFLVVPWGCLRLVIVVFPDHTHLLFLRSDVDGLTHTKQLLKSIVHSIYSSLILYSFLIPMNCICIYLMAISISNMKID